MLLFREAEIEVLSGPDRMVGCVRDIYGIGGGAILAPVLIGSGRARVEVALATLASTFVTSVAGVATLLVLATHHHGSTAPDWGVGSALGIGGLFGAIRALDSNPVCPRGQSDDFLDSCCKRLAFGTAGSLWAELQ
jgi:hypothetical protein